SSQTRSQHSPAGASPLATDVAAARFHVTRRVRSVFRSGASQVSSLRLPLWLCFFAALETGCSSGDLVVFETQAPGQGGDTGSPVATTDAWDAGTGLGGSMPDACVSGTDCSSFWLCSKANCQAQSGVCQPRPLFCPPEPDPVCGCDGVT